MKKLIIGLTVSAFALAGSLHAGDTKAATDKDRGGCCEKAKSSCCAAKSACSKTPSKSVLLSPKASELAAK